MLKNHPKGLVVLFFSNMGERFGYYTVMSIFVLFMQGKYGITKEGMGLIWGGFLFSIYFIPLLGGWIADKAGYGKIITIGIVLMIIGYAMVGIPGQKLWFIYVALFVIAMGTGFFKGNLAVILGNLYEEEKYHKHQAAAFNIFYMGINIGAFFAPYAAIGLRDIILNRAGLTYEAKIPGMAHQFLQGTLQNVEAFKSLAMAQVGDQFTNLTEFSNQYINTLGFGYNAGFAIAAVSIVVSLIIFLVFKKHYIHADYLHHEKAHENGNKIQLTPQQVKNRIYVLLIVFATVIFFWMAFHQNGLTLTWFARDYTAGSVSAVTKIFFDLPAFLGVLGAIIGLVFLLSKQFKGSMKGAGAGLFVVSVLLAYWRYSSFGEANPISPELFQSFNPIFVVFGTPVVLAFFAFLAKRNMEPSPTKKMAIGMLILAAGWILIMFGSRGLASPASLENVGGVSPFLVTPYWLINMYLIMTISELFISPMGLAFVAKTSPPQYRGMMQGGWLAATAIGNLLSGFVSIPWARLELWQTCGLLVLTSIIAGAFMFAMLGFIRRVTDK